MRFAKMCLIAAASALVWSTVVLEQEAMKDENSPMILQGGDNVNNAFQITDVPFSDSGTTVGYADDYDGNCGQDNGAPDVVYSFTPTYDMVIQVFLCWESDFDTRLYVFEDNPNTIIACNDDYCSNQHSDFISAIECLEISVGRTYYFVVDGYGTAAGNYSFDLTLPPPNVSISGYVTEYGDGPLGGVGIRVLQNGSEVWQDTTDDSGHYYVIYLPPGWYSVEASKLGYITQTSGPVEVSVCVEARVDFVLQREILPPIGVIAGLVAEADGVTPIEGALVRALQEGWEAFRDTTGPEGLYLMPEMQLGLYDLEASKTAYVTQTQFDIPVLADETTEVDFAMSREGPSCIYVPGDINGNGDANGVDVTYAVNYLKGIGPQPPVECPDCPNPGENLFAAGDVNGTCQFNGVDVTYYVNFLKGIGPALAFCQSCPPAGALAPPVPAIEPIRTPELKAKSVIKADG